MQNANWFQEEDLEEAPSLGLSSCFSTALAVFLLSPVISSSPGRWAHSHPDPPPTPQWWCEEPRALAYDHMHRYSPASMHRHNGEALAAPGRLAERRQRAAGICTSHEFTQQRSNRWRFVPFPGPRASPSVPFSGESRVRGREVTGGETTRGKGGGAVLHKLPLGY